jgi:hypothetical protein
MVEASRRGRCGGALRWGRPQSGRSDACPALILHQGLEARRVAERTTQIKLTSFQVQENWLRVAAGLKRRARLASVV